MQAAALSKNWQFPGFGFRAGQVEEHDGSERRFPAPLPPVFTQLLRFS